MNYKSKNLNLMGPVLWILSVQYYFVQLFVAAGWPSQEGYNWATNTISDLGNTVCGPYGANFVCSPYNLAMNISFVVLGATMITGALYFMKYYKVVSYSKFGFGLMAIAGLGTILVGLFPENSIGSVHILGAALPFIFGNLSMLVLGLTLPDLPKFLRVFTIVSGLIAISALVLFISNTYLGLGIGGMERIIAYPQSIWMIVFGFYALSINHENNT